MEYRRLQEVKKKTVGTKQTLKAVERGEPKIVYVAEDAETRVVEPIIKVCQEKGIPVVRVPSMRELGSACGIKVGCASAAVIEK
jgi:large subunit ribosomal protein L7A